MKQLNFEYQVKLTLSDYIHDHQFQLRCVPQDNCYQKVIDMRYSIYPLDRVSKIIDGFGNLVIAGSAIIKHKEFRFKVEGMVEVDYSEKKKEQSHPIYKFQTPLTTYSKEMEKLIPEEMPFLERMEALTHSIFNYMKYIPGSTNVFTKANEAFKKGCGVCQDYSHIMISIARNLGYPARYVAGMLFGEGASHAWVEIYNDGIWYAFDPTNNKLVDDNYIVLSKGRDYNDCNIDKGIFYGNCTQKLEVSVSVK